MGLLNSTPCKKISLQLTRRVNRCTNQLFFVVLTSIPIQITWNYLNNSKVNYVDNYRGRVFVVLVFLSMRIGKVQVITTISWSRFFLVRANIHSPKFITIPICFLLVLRWPCLESPKLSYFPGPVGPLELPVRCWRLWEFLVAVLQLFACCKASAQISLSYNSMEWVTAIKSWRLLFVDRPTLDRSMRSIVITLAALSFDDRICSRKVILRSGRSPWYFTKILVDIISISSIILLFLRILLLVSRTTLIFSVVRAWFVHPSEHLSWPGLTIAGQPPCSQTSLRIYLA